MMYLVDSGVWIGAANPKDIHHREATSVLKSILKGELGKALITDLIFSEVVTYIRRKVGRKQSVEAARMLIDSGHVEITHIDVKIFNAAYHMFERYSELSFADAASVAIMKDRGIQQIFSFDKGFDGVRDITRLETI
ncbi:MAG: PIN domain-containing protein [Methanobacteriota archaeon]